MQLVKRLGVQPSQLPHPDGRAALRHRRRPDYRYQQRRRITGQTSIFITGRRNTGVAFDTETGFLDYGARQYDPSIGRWMVVDQMSEAFDDLSPFNCLENNPVLMIAQDGMAATT